MTVEGDMVIREADRGDCRELAELRWLLQTGDRETAGPAFREFARHFDGGPASWLAYRHFVAETGENRLVGCAGLHHVQNLRRRWQGTTAAGDTLANCYVRPAWRNRGIGSRVIAAVREVTLNEGMELFVVWPGERAASVYRRLGFGNDGAPLALAHEGWSEVRASGITRSSQARAILDHNEAGRRPFGGSPSRFEYKIGRLNAGHL